MFYIVYFKYNPECNVEISEYLLNIKDHFKNDGNIKKIYQYKYKDDIYIDISLNNHLNEDDFNKYSNNIKDFLKYDGNICYKYKTNKNSDILRYNNVKVENKPMKLKFVDDN